MLGYSIRSKDILTLLNKLSPLVSGEGLGSLDGGTESAVNDELGKDTNGTGDTEEDGVVVSLSETVVLEEDTGVGVNVRVGVLGLAVLSEDTGGDLVDLRDELEHGVVGHLLLGKSALSHVTRVSLSENGVAVTGDDTAGVEGGPEVVSDGLVAKVIANGLLELGEPVEDLLVSKTVEGTSKTVETSGEREEGGAESRADKVSGVGRDVATLVVGVDGQVKTHKLNEVGVVGEAKLVGEVEGVILVLLDGSDLSALEDVLVDARSDVGELSNEVHRVLKGVSPVLLLVDTLGVGLGEAGGVLESSNGQGELSHGVEVGRAVVDELLDELGEIGAGSPLSGEVADLLLSRDLTSQEKPEETCAVRVSIDGVHIYDRILLTLRKGLLATGGLGEKLLALGDGLATESDTLLRVEDGTLPNEGLDATGTTVNLVKSDLVNDLGTMLPARTLAKELNRL
ncbi:hypothetical protein HG531_013832 [Fusarium graminearum]|nr:hypothetical protein HG531_013832 [Fusarium graminearum]